MADFSNQSKLFFLSATDNLRDPIRSHRWRVLVPNSVLRATAMRVTNGNQFYDGEAGTDDLALHIRTATIPEVTLTDSSYAYMGFNKHYPVNAKLDGQASFQSLFLEDVRAYEAMIAWQQVCVNGGVLVDETGADRTSVSAGIALGAGNHKDLENPNSPVLVNGDIKVELYNWMNLDVILTIKYINAYPLIVKADALSYDNPALMKFNFTLQYDRFTITSGKNYSAKLPGKNG